MNPIFSQTHNQRVKQINGELSRNIELINNQNRVKFSYVYKNDKAYGKNAVVVYDDFYKKYTISFVKEDGLSTSCKLTDNNFVGKWEFKFNGSNYSLSNYK
jgi:hypothetical protein